MCGIAGIFHFDQQAPDRKKLDNAAAALTHRGPDHQSTWQQGPIALAHTRLSIIDLAGGDQPLHHPKQDLHLVANGEIYNYLEHRQQYPDYPYTSQSDCESLLASYAAQGVQGLAQINGMFALALYDGQRKQLLLARDRLGIKPLFYMQQGNRLLFASELKGILAMLEQTPPLNADALLQFMQNQFYTGSQTIFQGIKQCLPGHYLLINEQGNVEERAYWQASEVQSQQIDLVTANKQFSELFEQVLTEHMRADVPFGLFLSGGIDSSILLAELCKRHTQPIETFSVGFSGTQMQDELPQAEMLAKQFGSKHHSLTVSRDQLFQRIVHSVWAADDLMRDYACLPTSLLSEYASQSLKVVFSGEGGDEAFAGYRRYKPSFEHKLKSLLLGGGGLRSSGQLSRSTPKNLFGSALQQGDFRATVKQSWQQSPAHWSRMQRAQYVDLHTALPDNLLVKADRMMMGFSLEGRVPFCDHRVVEFGLSLPDELKYAQNRGKWFLRQWAEKILPTEHLRQPKRGFYVPVNEWLSGDFLHQLGQKLQQNTAIAEWFNPKAIQPLVQAQQQGRNMSRELFCLMQFAIWHRLFVEGANKPAPQENPLDWL